MRGLNVVHIIGNVGQDPDLRSTASGNTVVRISIAVNTAYTTKDGEKKEHTEWINVVAWNKLAEIIGEYVTKGTPLFIAGRMATRDYEKDGVKRYYTEVIADKMIMLGGSKAGTTYQPDESQVEQSTPTKADDLPF